jgi:pyrroloquinoline quinone (PQQ) biosynthesis protein C
VNPESLVQSFGGAAAEAEKLIDSAIGNRRLLSHPFYQRWLDGTLEASELAAYAGQYRYFEAQLPAFLTTVLDGLPSGSAHDLVAANLTDETSIPAPHLDLFDSFAAAVGASADEPAPATEALVACYSRWAGAPAASAIGALAAYEVQAAQVAASKADGLRERYGLSAGATEFWDVHATADLDHARWVAEALGDLLEAGADVSEVAAAADDAAGAWWAFLDEREAARPLAA